MTPADQVVIVLKKGEDQCPLFFPDMKTYRPKYEVVDPQAIVRATLGRIANAISNGDVIKGSWHINGEPNDFLVTWPTSVLSISATGASNE